MDLYEKSEGKRFAMKYQERRRQLRITQVRQQTADWMSRSREEYKAEKDRQIRMLSDSLTTDIQVKVAESIKYHAESHSFAMDEIGAAHKAAARIPDLQSIKVKKKLMDDEVALKRHKMAVKQKQSNALAENLKQQENVRRKTQVRFEEDRKAKELVEKLPFGVRNLESDIFKDVGKKNMSGYQQSLAKTLHIPSKPTKKENKVPVQKKSTQTRKRTHSPGIKEGAFAKIAKEREAGATTPDLISLTSPTRKMLTSKSQRKQPPDVVYYDASLPCPPLKYKAPAGLVEPLKQKTSEPTAWTEAKQTNQELLEMKLRKSLDDIEKRKKTEQRGKAALKIAKLEQEFKQLEVDFGHGKELQSLRPILLSPSGISLVGLDESSESTGEKTYIHHEYGQDKVDQRLAEFEEVPIWPSPHSEMKMLDSPISKPKPKPKSNLSPKPAIVVLEGPTRITLVSETCEEEFETPKQSWTAERTIPSPYISGAPVHFPICSLAVSEFPQVEVKSGSFNSMSNYDSLSTLSPNTRSNTSISSYHESITADSEQLLSISLSEPHTSNDRKLLEDSVLSIRSGSSHLHYTNTISDGTSSSTKSFTPNSINRIRILLSEISSCSSSTAGTNYLSPPRKTTNQLQTPGSDRTVGPSTSTPGFDFTKTSSVSKSVLFKHYIKKLLARRPESIDSISSQSSSSGNSCIVLNSSATISSLTSSASSSYTRSTSDVSKSDRQSYDDINNLSYVQTHTSQHISHTVISTDKTDSGTTGSSSLSTEAVVTFKFTPTKETSLSSQSNTDESLAGALSMLCFRQGNVLDMGPTEYRGVEEELSSNSSNYYSADDQNITMSENSESQTYPRPIVTHSEELNRCNSQSSGSGTGSSDLASKESFRAAGDHNTTVISRPSPDTQTSIEINPFQQLSEEWANISIEKPDWL